MKRFVVVCLMALLAFDIYSAAYSSADSIVKIPVIDKSKSSGTTRRTPALIPIECCYDTFSNSVIVSFKFPIGEVEVTIVNNSTGYWMSETVSSESVPAIIPISGDSGFYSITFTSDGRQYSGEFEL